MTSRRNSGFSLVTVLSLGLISTMMLFAVTASILPLYQKASQNVPYVQLRNSAESAVNTVVGDLNNALIPGQTPLYDATTFGANRVETILGSPTTQITVKNIAPASGDFIYSSTYNFNPSKPIASASFFNSNPWRIVEVLAFFDKTQPPQVMARSVVRRTVMSQLSGGLQPPFLTSTNNSPPSAVFKYAAFAAQNLSVQNSRISGTNSFDGDLGTNGTVALSGGVNIDGSLTVSSATDSTSKGMTVATGSDSTQIRDQLLVNGKYSGFAAGDNVLGLGPSSTQPIPSTTTDPNKLPATPAAPSTANSLGDLNLQNGGSILFQNGVLFPPSASAMASFASGGQLKLPPGDYTVNSLNATGSGISTDSNLSQPVRLYVNGDSNSTVNISGAGIRNNTGVPSNLQLYYSGSNAVNVVATSFTGVVYAPGASVTASRATVSGSIIGNKVSIRRSSLKYDSTLGDVNFQTNTSRSGYTPASNLTFDPLQYSDTSSIPWAAMTCQEINNPH